ncbi:hypothetical protein BLNAU_23736 [Blattamonas nauphoetae]|uniref:Uncharacterized protein n=1 Tax=Blattamonas nauphoetae TaxID=2049346 RepID=A0ABQ9WPE0_9EUKA|nr:hypothetical protein BLNAU_23736 [Blattamonas nauphoetae]
MIVSLTQLPITTPQYMIKRRPVNQQLSAASPRFVSCLSLHIPSSSAHHVELMQILTEAFMLSPKQAKEKRTDPSKLPPSEARKLFTTTAHLKQDPPSREEENHHVTPKPITDRSGPLRGFSPIRTLRSQESTSPALRPPSLAERQLQTQPFSALKDRQRTHLNLTTHVEAAVEDTLVDLSDNTSAHPQGTPRFMLPLFLIPSSLLPNRLSRPDLEETESSSISPDKDFGVPIAECSFFGTLPNYDEIRPPDLFRFTGRSSPIGRPVSLLYFGNAFTAGDIYVRMGSFDHPSCGLTLLPCNTLAFGLDILLELNVLSAIEIVPEPMTSTKITPPKADDPHTDNLQPEITTEIDTVPDTIDPAALLENPVKLLPRID